MIPYGKQSINQEDIDSVINVLQSDFLTQGPVVPQFEKAFSDYVQSRFSIAVTNATSALHMACLSLGVGKGDMVWTSPISFVSSSNCALYCGADVDFVDIDPDTFNISANKLRIKLDQAKQKKQPTPKLVIVVHMAGQPCDMQAIAELAKEFDFKVIEDASHAVGAQYQNNPIGHCQYSDICVFSFHPVKIITTGEGGMLTTNKPEIFETLLSLRSHGITREPSKLNNTEEGPWYYEQQMLGFNYRMTELQGALGLSQLSRLDEFINQRKGIVQRYNEELSYSPITLPIQLESAQSSWHLYIVKVNKSQRLRVFKGLRDKGIQVNVHYIPIYKQPYYQSMGFDKNYCEQAEAYYEQAISLPIYPALTQVEQDVVINELISLLASS
jgi:UDP-4-amino-4,6-dideoxy-N-acetyl-beta-L-altrosamine transaminase